MNKLSRSPITFYLLFILQCFFLLSAQADVKHSNKESEILSETSEEAIRDAVVQRLRTLEAEHKKDLNNGLRQVTSEATTDKTRSTSSHLQLLRKEAKATAASQKVKTVVASPVEKKPEKRQFSAENTSKTTSVSREKKLNNAVKEIFAQKIKKDESVAPSPEISKKKAKVVARTVSKKESKPVGRNKEVVTKTTKAKTTLILSSKQKPEPEKKPVADAKAIKASFESDLRQFSTLLSTSKKTEQAGRNKTSVTEKEQEKFKTSTAEKTAEKKKAEADKKLAIKQKLAAEMENKADTKKPKMTTQGWVYLGVFENDQWIDANLSLKGELPKRGQYFTVQASTLNVRTDYPKKGKMGKVTKALAHKVKVQLLQLKRSGKTSHYWAEIKRAD